MNIGHRLGNFIDDGGARIANQDRRDVERQRGKVSGRRIIEQRVGATVPRARQLRGGHAHNMHEKTADGISRPPFFRRSRSFRNPLAHIACQE